MNNKLLLSILTIIPLVNIFTAIAYILFIGPVGKPKIVAILGAIPIINLFCGVLLTLDALAVIRL